MDEFTDRVLLAADSHLHGALAGERWARTADPDQVLTIGEGGAGLPPGVASPPDEAFPAEWAAGFLAGVSVVWYESEEYEQWSEYEPDHVVHAAPDR